MLNLTVTLEDLAFTITAKAVLASNLRFDKFFS